MCVMNSYLCVCARAEVPLPVSIISKGNLNREPLSQKCKKSVKTRLSSITHSPSVEGEEQGDRYMEKKGRETP